MDEEELFKKIDGIPGGSGWWHVEDKISFKHIAIELQKFSIPNHKILDILESVYSAVSNEYGK